MEKEEGQKGRGSDQRNVKNHFSGSKSLPGSNGDCFNDSLAGHDDDVGSHFDADPKPKDSAADDQGKESYRKRIRFQPGEQVHADVDEQTENHVYRNLQKLYRAEILSEQEQLSQDEKHIDKKGNLLSSSILKLSII